MKKKSINKYLIFLNKHGNIFLKFMIKIFQPNNFTLKNLKIYLKNHPDKIQNKFQFEEILCKIIIFKMIIKNL